MCGICGIVNFTVTEPVDGRLVERMTSVQAHRGPDDAGYFIEDNVGLGHRRLSIIDRSGGKQPMFNEDGALVVVFNGEIYNYADLTGDLMSRGHQFRTRSDTETIVHAYEEHGDDCMRDFRGMFAFAIWDRRRRRLFLVRDRLGIKPVYYYQGKTFFAFASEIKSLLQHPEVPREVDEQALHLYLALRYVPGPRTMFKHIFKLQPGHGMVVEDGKIRTWQYWDLQYPDGRGNHFGIRNSEFGFREHELIEKFEHLLEESVRLRLISEVPLGVFLSGGLDSSTMLAVMSRIQGGERVKTFSVGFDTGGPSGREASASNEFAFAREAAAHFGAEHHEFHLSPREFRNALPAMVSHLDEPMADPTCIPLYFISKLARNYITVVLSGEGADETMAGYTLYRTVLALEKLRGRLGPITSLIPALTALPVGDRVRAYMRRATELEDHYRGVVKGLPVETQLALLGPSRFDQSQHELDEVFGSYFRRVEKASALNRMLYVDAKVWLAEDLLMKADKMTMATSVELRVPFLDHKLVEFIAALPETLKVRQNSGKWILRHSMRTILPPSIIQRSKRGFAMPISGWLRSELREYVHDALLARDSACARFFDRQAVEEIVNRYERNRFSEYQAVWSLLVFEFWHKRFIEDFVSANVGEERPVEIDVASGHGA